MGRETTRTRFADLTSPGAPGPAPLVARHGVTPLEPADTGHFDLIDPASAAWPVVRDAVLRLADPWAATGGRAGAVQPG